ncbi:C6 transcription factor [Penicillium waksmanii]|uniref:C6 transcription factor n=1 Tax=Penicillium waksmanii TaxID=69791 RepID=UPI002546B2CA|nr:C6 transcription factor [Penicillium waksmanii]KAJ5994682.1 C6 transcription factor [Penicillium waksmanii]
MPRARVDPHNRRRVSQACDVCRKRKEKCDGNLPCGHCRSRSKDNGCRYTQKCSSSRNLRRNLAARSTTTLSPTEYTVSEGSSVGDASCTAVHALLGCPASADSAAEHTMVDSGPIPKPSHMLPDAKGKLIYIGQSASLSYLHIVQRVAAGCIGSCAFTDDTQQQCMIEKDISGCLGSHPEPEPELRRSLVLAEQYELSVSGVFDFFCASYLHAAIPPWIADPNRRDRPETPILYLVLAIGALGHASDDDDELTERYFNYGRQQAIIHLMDDPCLLTVIAFSLISYYMLASCRRNGAFTNLGIAARAAYALGIHRHETNRTFRDAARERAWKSLRVCDLFLSASMGRPPATSEADCNIPWSKASSLKTNIIDQKDNSPLPSQEDSAILKICLIFERILVEVFSKRAVSLDLAGSVSQQHRQWAEELPAMLKIDGLLRSDTSTKANIQKLGTHTVTMAYYYSIMLLCRPFLSFHVGTRLNKGGSPRDHNASSDSISTYADACVDSAIKSIALAKEIVFDESMPKRQPIIINDVFISALCLRPRELRRL